MQAYWSYEPQGVEHLHMNKSKKNPLKFSKNIRPEKVVT